MKSSKWQIVALGELQQPGGVGATQDYNPVTDGPNPDAALLDNAGNGPEQEMALETWVNYAVDKLNRGESPEAIVAQLAHDGCPDPQGVMQRAQAQPDNSPVSDSIGQDPFETPAPQDGQSGEMQGLSQQPPTLAHIDVRIAGKDWSKWSAENLPGTDPEGHPVSEVEKFIASMPPVEPTRPEIRVTNIERARRAIRGIVLKAAYEDQLRLMAADRALEDEQHGLMVMGVEVLPEVETLSAPYRHNAYSVADADRVPFVGNVKEAARIWASESPYGPNSLPDFHFALYQQGERLGLNGAQMSDYAHAASKVILARKVKTTHVAATETDNEGPAEELFI